jgi:hypothetical protein
LIRLTEGLASHLATADVFVAEEFFTFLDEADIEFINQSKGSFAILSERLTSTPQLQLNTPKIQ